jgi:hypothetical protein
MAATSSNGSVERTSIMSIPPTTDLTMPSTPIMSRKSPAMKAMRLRSS